MKRLKVPNSHSSQRWRSRIFGRVTEEVNTLKDYGIEYEIVPGVTSSAVATMDLGLTMRLVAPSVTFSTGHFKDSINQETDIRNLINGGTLAIYMGIKRLGRIIDQITLILQRTIR